MGIGWSRLLGVGLVAWASMAGGAGAAAQEPLPPHAATELEASRRAREAEAPGTIELEDFHRELAPHGRWVETPEFGYVFVPARQFEVDGWRPYLYGEWVWTEHGWTWASEEPFGWATYHYGRWTFAPSLGWCWIPGYVWGPAWVAWRFGAGAIGWAPLYPGFVFGGPDYPLFADDWLFVSPGFFFARPCWRHLIRRDHRSLLRETRAAGTFRTAEGGWVFAGPPLRVVERHGPRTIRPLPVVAAGAPSGAGLARDRAGRPTELRTFRPGRSPAPDGSAPVGSGLVPVERTPSAQVRLPAPEAPLRTERAAPPSSRTSRPIPAPRAAPAPEAPREGEPVAPAPGAPPGGTPPPGEAPPVPSPREAPPAPPPREAPPATPPREAPPAPPPRESPPATPPRETPPATPPRATPPTTPPREAPPATPPREAPPATPPREAPPATPPREAPPATPPREVPPKSPPREAPSNPSPPTPPRTPRR
ncbi:MAG TPA: DUF6600 domain-containing protein [Vulgatibacter sp.]|nr:DUF6600 domain-containing protein [Vulgatibacter sp.]